MSRIPDFSQIPFQQAPAQGAAEFAAWKEKLKTETGKSFEENFYRTMEQINVAPLYDVNAYKDCEHLHYMAGIPPFLRGPYSTMYVTKPWTVRQYAGFSTAEEQMLSIAVTWRQGKKVCLSHLTLQLTAVMTPIIRALSVT